MAEGNAVDLNKQVQLEGIDTGVTLADLANLDMDQIAEKRGMGPFPRGRFVFEVEEGKLDSFETEIEGIKRSVPCVKILLKTFAITALMNSELDTEEGRKEVLQRKFHVFIGFKGIEDTGRLKAFMIDTGYKGSGKMQQLLDGWKGTRFNGEITHKKNKNDADNPYVNLNMEKDKITPYKAEQAAA